ncbi:MAG: twin-arginine translocation signal domain-containing protein [Candidatus Nealsonbacteria bacterium]|nr:twin-arginine translocation signal domain-containing protein [Candidatus Nealsonbacteria bacterium]
MNAQNQSNKPSTSRRDFLKRSGGALTGAALASAVTTRAYAAEDNTIKLALIGCGGRGTGAANNALSTAGPSKLVAMADVFPFRMEGSLKNLAGRFKEKVDVPAERQFIGMDAFKKATEAVGENGLVLLTTPPCFRPIHMEHAIANGRNVFMEKSFAVDGPGIRRVLAAGKEATKKNLKVAGGLMSRHSKALENAVEQIHNGLIGDVITCWAYREHGLVGYKPRRPGMNELQHQIHNYSNFTWINGSFLLDWLIHNLDVCCWVKGSWPVSAQGQGGRQARPHPDQLFDHYAVEYTFADGTRMFAQGRHMQQCWGFFGDVIHGTKGSAVLGEGKPNPLIYKGYNQSSENVIWKNTDPSPNQYQVEHDLLFDAIRQDKPYNEAERCAYAALTGILGRMAAESGKMVTWEEALDSNLELAPGLDDYTLESDAPVNPDKDGNYPVATPGVTKAL